MNYDNWKPKYRKHQILIDGWKEKGLCLDCAKPRGVLRRRYCIRCLTKRRIKAAEYTLKRETQYLKLLEEERV